MHPYLTIDLRFAACVTAAVCLGTSGCQTSDGQDETITTPSSSSLLGSTDVISPLLDDEGAPTAGDPRARPVDAAAWTTRGLYATDGQAQMTAGALGDTALKVDIGCCGVEAIDAAVDSALARRARNGLPPSAPVFVRGTDLRLAAAVANRLTSGGMSNVWVVTP